MSHTRRVCMKDCAQESFSVKYISSVTGCVKFALLRSTRRCSDLEYCPAVGPTVHVAGGTSAVLGATPPNDAGLMSGWTLNVWALATNPVSDAAIPAVANRRRAWPGWRAVSDAYVRSCSSKSCTLLWCQRAHGMAVRQQARWREGGEGAGGLTSAGMGNGSERCCTISLMSGIGQMTEPATTGLPGCCDQSVRF